MFLHNEPGANGHGINIAISASSLRAAESRRQNFEEEGHQLNGAPLAQLGVISDLLTEPAEKLLLLGLLPTIDPFKGRKYGSCAVVGNSGAHPATLRNGLISVTVTRTNVICLGAALGADAKTLLSQAQVFRYVLAA